VCELECQKRIQVTHLLCAVTGDYCGRVDQAFGEDDRVPDRKRLKWLREQSAYMDRATDCNLVVCQDIVGQGLQRLVELAGCIQQTGLEQALHDVIFSLLGEGALCSERAQIGSIVGDVGRADYVKRRVLCSRRRNL